MQTEIITARLVLNNLSEDDYEFICSLVNSKGWLEFIGNRNVHSKQDAIEYIRRLRNTPNLYYWVVTLKNSTTAIGIISFLKRSYLEHFDIGFAFLPQYNGHGYAYEAAEKVLSIASNKTEYATILATTVPQNEKSIRLLTKLGMHFEKEIEADHQKIYVFSK